MSDERKDILIGSKIEYLLRREFANLIGKKQVVK